MLKKQQTDDRPAARARAATVPAQVPATAAAVPSALAGILDLQRFAGNGAVAGALAPAVRLLGSVTPRSVDHAAADRSAARTASVGSAASRALQRATATSADVRRPAVGTPAAAGEPAAVQRGVLDDVAAGVSSVTGGVRDSVLRTLSGWARRMPGYDLLCTVLGRDVVAGTPVPRSAAAVVGGFVALMPRGEELRQQLQESGAIDRAGAWFEEEIPKLGLSWEVVRGLFTRAWDALSATDLLDPAGAWAKISGIFGPPLGRLRDFAVGAVTKVGEFVFEAAMTAAGGLGAQVMGIIRQAGGVFSQIVRNPVGFAGNLVAAVRGGLGAFLSNIGTHLRNGLIGWLTGSLGGVIRLPAQFDLRGILGMAMEFLGLTWANVRARIARVIGERAMGLLERGASVVQDVAEHGIGALIGRISQFTSGLVDTVLGGIREWVTNSVVGAAITRLLSMFNPAGAAIQAIIAVYNTIQFFIERAQQLGALASSIFGSISAIAAGNIGNAVTAVEGALGRTVPVVLGFLARLIGLGDIATPVRNVMTRVQTVIDSAIDRVVGWIAGLARRVRDRVSGRPAANAGQAQTPRQMEAAAMSAAEDGYRALSRGVPPAGAAAALQAVLERHRARGVKSLELEGGADGVQVKASVNPTRVWHNKMWVTISPIVVRSITKGEEGQTGGMTSEDLLASNKVTATGHFLCNGRGFEFGSMTSSEGSKYRRDATRSGQGAHAEEQVTNAFEEIYQEVLGQRRAAEAGAPRAFDIELGIDVSVSSCPNCALHIANFVRRMRADGCTVRASMKFGALYHGPNAAFSPQGRVVVPEATPDERVLRDLFFQQGTIQPVTGGRIWGWLGPLMKQLAPTKGFESLPSGPKAGKYGLGILQSAGVQIDLLQADERNVTPDQKQKLGDKRAKLEAAIADVNKMLQPVKVG